MKLTNKLFLLSMLCLLYSEVTASQPAFAGVTPVLPPDSSGSGLGDTFSNPEFSNRSKLSCTNNGVVNTLRNIQRSQSVSSVSGRKLAVSPSQIDEIESLLVGDRPTAAQLEALAQQVTEETGIDVEISRSGLSSSELQTAIGSANELVNALDSQQLAATADSPALMTLLQLIKGGNESMPGLDSLAGECETGLLKVGLAPVPVPVEAPIDPAPVEPIRVQEPAPEPEPAPTFQEPIRGLW